MIDRANAKLKSNFKLLLVRRCRLLVFCGIVAQIGAMIAMALKQPEESLTLFHMGLACSAVALVCGVWALLIKSEVTR